MSHIDENLVSKQVNVEMLFIDITQIIYVNKEQ